MGGILFRLGMYCKDTGERWRWGWLIGLGLCIGDFMYRHGVIEHGKIKIQ
ncbi:MAG: hypothetical protein LBC99_01990 [Spirochaetota bacterium]|jgi:hypothetical protein|nr:hypothetical protein [Spirochaetota bacterium]